jgi:hypothetical protein
MLITTVADDDDRGFITIGFDEFEPVFNAILGFVFAVVKDEKVEATFSEEELVGAMHHLLSTEVPVIVADGLVTLIDPPGFDVDTGSFRLCGIEGLISKAF